MRYKNEAGQSEVIVPHLGRSLLSQDLNLEFILRLDKCLRFSMTWHLRDFRIFSGTRVRTTIII